jgi:hypothetical protein
MLLVALANIQYTRDNKPTISCTSQDKNIDKAKKNMWVSYFFL